MNNWVIGIDIGGTRTKIGLVNLSCGEIGKVRVFDTGREDESAYYKRIKEVVEDCLKEEGLNKEVLKGAGVSIGTYVFSDGTTDGMSVFVPYMKEGHPLVPRMEAVLDLPVRADNDVRLICLAEANFGLGKDYKRVMGITLGSGVGIGVCVDKKPFGDEPFNHLAGHIKVRDDYNEVLDKETCYCGLSGCFESTGSGTSLEKLVRAKLGNDVTNEEFFKLAKSGDVRAKELLNYYIDIVACALNQYVYIYCPDIIILGGGVSRGLAPYLDVLKSKMVAKVHYRQKNELAISSLMEDSGVLGAALLFNKE